MARLPVPSVKKLGKSSHEVQMLLLHLSDPAGDLVQAVHCTLHRSPYVILYTKQQIKKLLRTSTQELYFECHLMITLCKRMFYILFPLSVCLSRLYLTDGTGRRDTQTGP